MGTALGDRVHQGVHHGVKDDDRQQVTLVDSQLEVVGAVVHLSVEMTAVRPPYRLETKRIISGGAW